MRVIFTGGGTGGHLFPALAIAEEFIKNNPEAEFLYLGNGRTIEAKEVPARGIPFKAVPSRWLQLGYKGLLWDISEVFQSSTSMLAGLIKARSIIKKFKPDIAIGSGGFVSFPVILAAENLGVKCYIHEQNATPGRGNRIMAKKARKIFTGFPGTDDSLGYPEKTIYVGNPVREEFFNLDKKESRKTLGIPEDDFVVFTVGGSTGAEILNEIALEYAKRINKKEGTTLICGTGNNLFDIYKEKALEAGIELGGNIRLEGFISNIKDCIAAADLVVCRAGAMTIAELLVAGKPSIIVPYPGSVGEHQYYNAKTIQDAGGAIMYEQKDADPIVVCNTIEELEKDRERIRRMGEACLGMAPESVASKIYREIMADYEKN